MCLSLLAHSGLSTKYWVDAVLTAVFLINRLPSRVPHNHSPYHKFYKLNPNYSLLRVFGSACYPLLRPYNAHKLAFRSTKRCIFLGYSSNHKGYQCLDPLTNRVYISRNVVFDESSFLVKSAPPLDPAATDCSSFSSPHENGTVSNSQPFAFYVPISPNVLPSSISGPSVIN